VTFLEEASKGIVEWLMRGGPRGRKGTQDMVGLLSDKGPRKGVVAAREK